MIIGLTPFTAQSYLNDLSVKAENWLDSTGLDILKYISKLIKFIHSDW